MKLTEKDSSLINHPTHYNHGKIEPIDVIEDWELEFHLGNVIKYIARYGHTGYGIRDLQKAQWYLARYIQLKETPIDVKTNQRNKD